MELFNVKEKIILKEKSKLNYKKPNMYKVLLHNDDYTTMEFVIEVLIEVFRKNSAEANKIMYDVHKKGIGVAGLYTRDIALTKIKQATYMSELNEFPLKMTVEKE